MPNNATIKVLGIEVVQSIQNLENEIPLLADKETMVRVYVRPSKLSIDMPVTGTLELRRTNGQKEEISKVESELGIELRKDDRGDDNQSFLAAQRRSLDRSLNFRLSPDQIKCGKVRAVLKQVTPALRSDPELTVQDNGVEVNFEPGPVLRFRAIGLRVRDPRTGHAHAPSPRPFKALKSFLKRAFPASKVEWTDLTIDAAAGFEPPYSSDKSSIADPGSAWQENFDIACAHLMAIRARDIDSGLDRPASEFDPRTHYYGLVYHPNDFFVGAVSNVPDAPRPDVIGIGPAMLEDGSYGAHELAHSLGRLHPGICGRQTKEDLDLPAEYQGQLSSSGLDQDHPHYGLDVGDGIERPRVLPSDEWYDLMTYCHPLWVSDHSYKGMLERLREEEKLVEQEKSDKKGGADQYLQIVGTYNLNTNQGAIGYVFPVRTKSPAAEESERRVVVVGTDAEGEILFETNVELKRAAATDLPQHSGAFQITVSPWDTLSKLELRVDGTVADSRSKGETDPCLPWKFDMESVELVPPVISPEDPYFLKITWPRTYDHSLRHTVQARLPGQDWQTIAIDINDTTSEVFLDRSRFELPPQAASRHSTLEVQILRTSGFSETPIYEGSLTIGSYCEPKKVPRTNAKGK